MRICLYDSGRGAYFLGQKLSDFKLYYFIDTKTILTAQSYKATILVK